LKTGYTWRKCDWLSTIPPFRVSPGGLALRSLWTEEELHHWENIVANIYSHDKTRQSYGRVCADYMQGFGGLTTQQLAKYHDYLYIGHIWLIESDTTGIMVIL